MEHYDNNNAVCRSRRTALPVRLDEAAAPQRYLSGVYAHQTPGRLTSLRSYNSPSYARPDAVWIARWD